MALIQDYHKMENTFSNLPISWAIYESKLKTAALIVINPELYHVESLKLNNSVFINISIKQEEQNDQPPKQQNQNSQEQDLQQQPQKQP